MDKRLSFGIEGFDVIDDCSDNQLAIVEIYVCHDGNNLHDMPIDLSVIKRAKRTLKNKFLVAGFDGNDFEGHEPDEQIVGFFPESSEMKFVEKDGRVYLVAQAIMSKVYAKWAYDVFVEDKDNNKAVSMEITVLSTEICDDGLEYITDFVFNGVTLLGESHMPACEGANASIIKFSKENALQIYSKRMKNSEKIKKNFMKDMELAEGSRKEESEKMDKNKKVVEAVEEVIKTPIAEEKVMEKNDAKKEKETSNEETYMEDETKTEDEKSEVDKESENKKEKSSEEESDKEDEKSEEDKDEDEKEIEENNESNKDFESLTVEQKYEVFRSAVKESLNGCGYLETYDEEYLYIYEYCEGNTFRYSYTLDGMNCIIDIDSRTRVMCGGYIEFEVFEQENNKIEVLVEALEKENHELKEELAAYKTKEKDEAVEKVLSEVIDVLPAERIAELREEAVNYSLDNLSVFKNEVKAIAFEVVANQVKGKKYSFERMPINEGMEQKTSKYGW